MKNEYEIRGDVVVIFIRKRDGSVVECLIDKEDLPRVCEFPNTWFVLPEKAGGYVVGHKKINGKQISFRIHRWILNPPNHLDVDHINHNTLDNRRSNLRLVDDRQNQQNRTSTQSNNRSSGYRGVTWSQKGKTWRVRVQVDGKTRTFGTYRDLDEAVKMARKVRQKLMPFCQEENGE